MPENWKQIAISPLSAMLDTRSRPAELAPGAMRYKLNMAVNRTGALCTRSGYQALNFGPRSDTPSAVPNWDFHRRGGQREPVTFLFESVGTDGTHRIFEGTESEIRVLNNDTSEWTTITDGWSGAVWKAAGLQNVVVFANNVNVPGVGGYGARYHTLGGGSTSIVLADSAINRAKVAVSYSGVVMLMNVYFDGAERRNRVMWSDKEIGYDFRVKSDSIAGFQDLDYGDEILAAIEMAGVLYIFTARAIWRCIPNPSTDPTTPAFLFQKIYSDPKAQSACLVYANTLVSTGRELYWWGHDAIWTFNPYIVAPECPEWLLKGTGALYSDANVDRFEKRCCESIVGEYWPDRREIHYSYPVGQDSETAICINNREIVLNVEYHTMDITDAGFTSYTNFRRTAASNTDCNAGQFFIGASGADYTLKDFSSNVFYRENVTLIGGSKTADIPDANYATTRSGYYCRGIGVAPFGLPNQEKIVRELLLDHEIAPNDLASPNLLTLRIGNSFNLVDPVSLEARCSPSWHPQESLPLTCPDQATIAAMLAENQRPSDPLSWTMWETGNRLYWDLRVVSHDGSAPMQHDAAFSAMRFDVMVV